MAAFLGIDAGTTSMKAALFDIDGHLLAIDSQEYQLVTPSPSMVELDPEVYWQACCLAVRNVIERSGTEAKEVAALCISSQGETLIPIDKEGIPTRDAIVWLDNRAVEEAGLIGNQFEVEEVYHTTGQPEIAPIWPACKILWIKRNEPDVFARSVKFLLLEEYLLFRLTGQFVAEYSLQASNIMLDIQQKRWWEPMLDFIGLSPDRLGRLMEPGQVVGPLSGEGAEATGLSNHTIAVSGGIDATIGAVGSGNIVPNVVTETTGGALAIVVTLERPFFDPERRLPCHYHARQDRYCLLPWGKTGGMALRWFRDQFYPFETQVARESGLDAYDLMTRVAAQVPAGADGLVVLPHLEGTGSPDFNPAAKAVFYGATLRHTRGHFVRAIMESVAYMLKENLDIIEKMGIPVKEVRSMGGGARSELWLQIKADVLQKPVTAVEVEEAACLGGALLAAAATGYFASLEDGASRMVRVGETVEPSRDHREEYQEGCC
jgi:xylulokinase